MIDWADVALNSLWIVGLAVILAALGYHDWLAHRTGVRLRALWAAASWRRPAWLGLCLVCLSLTFARRSLWEGVFKFRGRMTAFGWGARGL